MNIIIPSIFTLTLASIVLYSILSRFSGYTIFILAIISLIIVLYNNITMFGYEYKYFIDFFETFGGRVMFVVIIGGIIFIILGFISKMDIVKVQMQKVFSSTSTPIDRIMKIEKQL